MAPTVEKYPWCAVHQTNHAYEADCRSTNEPMDTKPITYVMSRDDYRRIADEIMHYVVKASGSDQMTMLPFVTNITEEIRPVVEGIVNRHVQRSNLVKNNPEATDD